MKIQIRYFASVREKLGAGETLDLEGSDAPKTVGQLQDWLARTSEKHELALAETRGLRTAIDQALCSADEPLHDGAEVAFFPPVTGG